MVLKSSSAASSVEELSSFSLNDPSSETVFVPEFRQPSPILALPVATPSSPPLDDPSSEVLLVPEFRQPSPIAALPVATPSSPPLDYPSSEVVSVPEYRDSSSILASPLTIPSSSRLHNPSLVAVLPPQVLSSEKNSQNLFTDIPFFGDNLRHTSESMSSTDTPSGDVPVTRLDNSTQALSAEERISRLEKEVLSLIKALRSKEAKIKSMQAARRNEDQRTQSLVEMLKGRFGEDQLNALARGGNARGAAWSDRTLVTGVKINFACGTEGLKLVSKLQMPLPAIRTQNQHLQKFKFKPGTLTEVWDLVPAKTECMPSIHKAIELDRNTNEYIGRCTLPASKTHLTIEERQLWAFTPKRKCRGMKRTCRGACFRRRLTNVSS